MRVLLIEDDRVLGHAVRDHVATMGHGVDLMRHLADARAALATIDYDLVLLDLNLPDGRGMDFLRELRGGGSLKPLIILTAQDQIAARIEGLNSGADDYLVKPFDLSELTARIAAVSRRYLGNPNPALHVAGLAIDLSQRIVQVEGQSVDLTAREWAVLERLVRRPNATVTKPELEDALYEFGAEVESNAVEVFVSRLRKKLGKETIVTLRGIGYRMASA